ncbi:hypothetical protein JCM15765_13520 [Paradesulfitobacterium aromaticivorans]
MKGWPHAFTARGIVGFCLSLMLLLSLNTSAVFAQDMGNSPALGVHILSPQEVKGYAGKEDTVKVSVNNNTNQPLHDILVYITMADLQKNSTVNLEDFNADKPVLISELGEKKSKIVNLPVRFVYTSQYDLYVTAIAKSLPETSSSSAIPVEIVGNTQVDKNQVLLVSSLEPVFVLFFVLLMHTVMKKRKERN